MQPSFMASVGREAKFVAGSVLILFAVVGIMIKTIILKYLRQEQVFLC